MSPVKVTLRSLLLLSSTLMPVAAYAQDQAADADEEEAIIVTATRRAVSVQDVPFNIAAVGGEQLEEQRSFNLREVSRLVPGVYIVDNGSRTGAPIVFRGLNADPLGSFDNDTDGGGTVGLYLGEIPLYVDLRLHDVERVEFLIGPQGTLYGAGTLGGAIRYIPRRPVLGEFQAEARTDVYTVNESHGLSTDSGLTINVPIADFAAVRVSVDYLDDQGFIDYPYTVITRGVSDPDPDFTDPAAVAANLRRERDVNFERTLFARAALRVNPRDWIDVNLAYTRQEQEVGGRQISGIRVDTFPVPVGQYESILRVVEPNERDTELFSIEAVLDLGFAELTSATGWSRQSSIGQRDQTDLLIGLEYSYEAFPTFTAFTLETDSTRTFTQEVRLVSQHGGPFRWIVGGFYNNQRFHGESREFTPGYDVFLGGSRPDALEYFAVSDSRLRESAFYGELTYQITPEWTVTAGGRYYNYDLETQSAVDLPLLETVFNGRAPDSIVLNFIPGGQDDSGFLFKVNTSYNFTPDVMAYATVSEGYRIGNSNGVPACPTPLPGGQIVCALPNEVQFFPDSTLNFELGLKSQWWNRRLTFNAAVYYVKWSDPQVASATQNGLSPITINGAGAESKGLEIAAALRLGEFTFRANYAYTDPQLTDLTVNLIPFITPPGFQSTLAYLDGQPGDRLPGSPRHQFNLFASWEREIRDNLSLGLSYSASAQSDVIQSTGERGNNTTLPGFSIHNAAVTLSSRHWSVQLYADNLFDNFVEVGVRGAQERNQIVFDANGDPVYVRTFGTYVLSPRTIGLRLTAHY